MTLPPMHPKAAMYRLMCPDDLKELASSIESEGQTDPIVFSSGPVAKGLLIDGRNRWLACEIAHCDPITIEREFFSEEQITKFIESKNDFRRHLTEEEQTRNRLDRIERVMAARSGKVKRSLRDIAAQEGVSEKTIRNDLAFISTADPSAVENSGADPSAPAIIQGRDGKHYQLKTSLLISKPEQRTGPSLFDGAAARQQEKAESPAPVDSAPLAPIVTKVPPKRLRFVRKARTRLRLGNPKESFQGWNTPEWLLCLIRQISDIALDPFHNEYSLVNAKVAFTKEENGMRSDVSWADIAEEEGGLVYVNPPYSDPMPVAERIILEAERAEIIACLPSSHSTEWFKLLRYYCQGFAQMNRRVAFGREGNWRHGARHETTLFYFGPKVALFKKVFFGLDDTATGKVKNFAHVELVRRWTAERKSA